MEPNDDFYRRLYWLYHQPYENKTEYEGWRGIGYDDKQALSAVKYGYEKNPQNYSFSPSIFTSSTTVTVLGDGQNNYTYSGEEAPLSVVAITQTIISTMKLRTVRIT